MSLPPIPFPIPSNMCNLNSLLRSATALNPNFLSSIANGVTNKIQVLASQLQNLPSHIKSVASAAINNLITSLEVTAANVVSSLISHVVGQVTNLTNQLSTAINHLALGLGLSGSGCPLPSLGNTVNATTPCTGMDSFFGAIMGGGASSLNALATSLDSLLGPIAAVAALAADATDAVINAAVGVINSAFAAVTTAINAVTDLITNEINMLAQATADLINHGIASALNSLWKNQCAQPIIAAVATPQLTTALGHV